MGWHKVGYLVKELLNLGSDGREKDKYNKNSLYEIL